MSQDAQNIWQTMNRKVYFFCERNIVTNARSKPAPSTAIQDRRIYILLFVGLMLCRSQRGQPARRSVRQRSPVAGLH